MSVRRASPQAFARSGACKCRGWRRARSPAADAFRRRSPSGAAYPLPSAPSGAAPPKPAACLQGGVSSPRRARVSRRRWTAPGLLLEYPTFAALAAETCGMPAPQSNGRPCVFHDCLLHRPRSGFRVRRGRPGARGDTGRGRPGCVRRIWTRARQRAAPDRAADSLAALEAEQRSSAFLRPCSLWRAK